MSATSDDGRASEVLTHAEWAAALADGELLGQRCSDCGHGTAAPKAACARCGSRRLETVSLPTEGVVYSETTVAVAPAGFDGDGGYRVAVIDLGDARVLGRLEGKAGIGDQVEFVGPLEDCEEVAPLFA